MKLRWELVSIAYAGLGILGAGLSQFVHHHAFVHPTPILLLTPLSREAISCGLGLFFASFMVVLTRVIVNRTARGATLHRRFRPIAYGLSVWEILAIALLSGFGEELLFRAFLCPLVGVVPQALIFGLAHQLPGPGRWTWIAWASLVGLVLGLLYQYVGSLSGPILAHATINAINLLYLRDNEPSSHFPQ